MFQKSSYSNADCVEAMMRDEDGAVLVRHSQQPDGAVHTFTAAEWRAFIAGVKDGEFDFGLDIAGLRRTTI